MIENFPSLCSPELNDCFDLRSEIVKWRKWRKTKPAPLYYAGVCRDALVTAAEVTNLTVTFLVLKKGKF